MGKSGVTDRDMGYRNLIEAFTRLQSKEVVVGIIDGQIAQYAFYNEFGTGTIPSRPFMRSTVDGNRSAYFAAIDRHLARDLGRTRDPVVSALTRVGLTMRNDIVKAIRNWSDPPNAPSTVHKKGVNNPLVDTAAMQQAVTFEVRNA